MGAAAYNRGSRLVREQAEATARRVYRDHPLGARLDATELQLERAKRALRLEAAKLTEERAKSRAAYEVLVELRDGYRGKASQGHYVATLAQLRVGKILGFQPGEVRP